MNPREWALAWARFDSLRAHAPTRWDEEEVTKYHDILSVLEQASGEDLSAFQVSDNELRQKVISSNYRHPSQVRMSEKRYCDEQTMRQKMEGVVMYFQNLQSGATPKKFGF